MALCVLAAFVVYADPVAKQPEKTDQGSLVAEDSQETDSIDLEDEVAVEPEPVRVKPIEREVRALYVTAHTAANRERMQRIIDIINATELNAVVIDIKDYTGHIYFDTTVPLAQELNLSKDVLVDIEALIEELHAQDIYVIARQTVFQDPALAQARPEWAVQDSAGGLWHDWKGLTWVDTTIEEVWDYNIALAQDAVALGFDEINFDYIRFPSDGPLARMRFKNWDGSFARHEIVAGFFGRLYEGMKDEPVYLSADLFGLTTIREDDMSIGQLIEDAAPFFDYIMPMMYPSHYPSGFYGFANPAEHPYEVLYPGVVKARERVEQVPLNRAKIRPWIQDFDIGAVYNRPLVQAQIRAIEDAGGYGFASWNARNVYVISDY